MPCSFPLENSSAQMLSHQGQDLGKAFPAPFLGILSHDFGWPWAVHHPLPLWDCHLQSDTFQHELLDFPWCPSILSQYPGILQLLQIQHSTRDPGVLAFQVFWHSSRITCLIQVKIPKIFEVKLAPGKISSRSSGISGFGIPRARITGNVPVPPGAGPGG